MIWLWLAIVWLVLSILILACWPRRDESIHEEEWENDNGKR